MATTPSLPASVEPEEMQLTPEEEELLAQAEAEEEANRPLVLSPAVSRLPVQLDVRIPVREFRVRHLLSLDPGQVVETDWANGEDMPLASGKVQLAWSEFEVVDTQLAVRVTRLS